jgi:hypothetical protein
MRMHLVHELPMVSDPNGSMYSARVVGAPAEDGLWDGAIEFRAADGTTSVTHVETRQPNLASLVYWSTGLSPVYVEGALDRALAAAEADSVALDWAFAAAEAGARARLSPTPPVGEAARPKKSASSVRARSARPAARSSRPARVRPPERRTAGAKGSASRTSRGRGAPARSR